ncbi:MAG: DNA primase, partial [bacterium]
MNPSDQIKARLNIVDVIKEYIQIKPAGVNFTARCPFHNEKSPSFMISPDKQIYHCFGCGKGGDMFSFVMDMEGLSFVEALRLLAPKAGIELKREDPKISSQRNRLLDIMALAVKYYHYVLMETKQGEAARDYLKKRGLLEETVEEWQIGYSPDSWEDLIKFLLGKGFNENEIFLAGLSIKKEEVGRYYNRFRGRIMFPLNDLNGNPVAFTARVSPEKEATEKMGKYINSPQTAIFDKGKILFGLDKGKQVIKNENLVIVTEGQMDVITAHQNGFRNVVASSGTALTENQVAVLKRYTDNFALAFDSDAAGQNAILRGDNVINKSKESTVEAADRWGRVKTYLDPTLTSSINLSIIEIPNGKDPDDCIRNSPEIWIEAVKNAKSIMQFYFDKTLQKYDIISVDGKKHITKELLPTIMRLGSRIEQEGWVQKLAKLLGISENLLWEAMPSQVDAKKISSESVPTERQANTPATRDAAMSELALALVLRFPVNAVYLFNNLQVDYLQGEHLRTLYKNLVIYYNQNNDNWVNNRPGSTEQGLIPQESKDQEGAYVLNYHDFKEWLVKFDLTSNLSFEAKNQKQEFNSGLLDRLIMLAEKEYYSLTDVTAKNELIKIVHFLKKNYLQLRLKKIEGLLSQAEMRSDKLEIEGLLEEFKIISEE